MKPYSPSSNIGRVRSVDDVHHRTRDQSSTAAAAAAKCLRHAARQDGRLEVGRQRLDLAEGAAPRPGLAS